MIEQRRIQSSNIYEKRETMNNETSLYFCHTFFRKKTFYFLQ